MQNPNNDKEQELLSIIKNAPVAETKCVISTSDWCGLGCQRPNALNIGMLSKTKVLASITHQTQEYIWRTGHATV